MIVLSMSCQWLVNDNDLNLWNSIIDPMTVCQCHLHCTHIRPFGAHGRNPRWSSCRTCGGCTAQHRKTWRLGKMLAASLHGHHHRTRTWAKQKQDKFWSLNEWTKVSDTVSDNLNVSQDTVTCLTDTDACKLQVWRVQCWKHYAVGLPIRQLPTGGQNRLQDLVHVILADWRRRPSTVSLMLSSWLHLVEDEDGWLCRASEFDKVDLPELCGKALQRLAAIHAPQLAGNLSPGCLCSGLRNLSLGCMVRIVQVFGIPARQHRYQQGRLLGFGSICFPHTGCHLICTGSELLPNFLDSTVFKQLLQAHAVPDGLFHHMVIFTAEYDFSCKDCRFLGPRFHAWLVNDNTSSVTCPSVTINEWLRTHTKSAAPGTCDPRLTIRNLHIVSDGVCGERLASIVPAVGFMVLQRLPDWR